MSSLNDEGQAAKNLAQFVDELRRIDSVVGAPGGGPKPIGELDAVTSVRLPEMT